MPGAEQISIDKAATAQAYADMGYSTRQVEARTGIDHVTVHDIISRHGRWSEVAETPVFRRLRTAQSQILEASARTLAAKAMIQCENTLDQANAYQSCLIAGIMIDKSRLLAGESTENIAVSSKVELVGLDNFCALLSQSMLESNATSPSTTDQKSGT